MVITCSRSATVQTRPCYGSFQCYFGKAVAVDRPDARSSHLDAVRTPSGILVITSYSNIWLGRNRCRWKANKKCCKLMVRTAIRIVRAGTVRMETSSVRMALHNFPELLFEHGNSSPSERPRLPSGRSCQRLWFYPILGLLKPINKRLEACIRHRIRWWIPYSLEIVFREILKIC
jgi:hypothetical protein